MGKPQTLLEGLCEHALGFGVESFVIVREGAFQRAWAEIDGARTRILNFNYVHRDAKELRENLAAALSRRALTVINGRRVVLRVRRLEEDAHEVTIEQAPPLDTCVVPSFTAKQGQYLAFIYNYSKIHGRAPAESDLQRYFRTTPPSVHQMIKTLELKGFIERTPGQARSIRLLVPSDYLPKLG